MRDSYYDTPDFRRILKKYEDAQSKGEPVFIDSDDLIRICEYYQTNGEESKAVEGVRYALKLFPGAVEPLAFLSRYVLLVKKDPEKARKYAEQIQDKNDVDYFYLIAEIMIVEQRQEEADNYLEEQIPVVEEEEEEEEISIQDYYFDVANLFADYNLCEIAQKWLDKDKETDATDYKELDARIAIGLGNFKKANKIYQQILDDNPYAENFWNKLASSQFLQGDFCNSIQSSEYAIAINTKDDEAILNKANGLFSLENYTEAEKYFRKYVQLMPDNETGELFLGMTLFRLNKLTSAFSHIKKAEILGGKDNPNLKEIYEQLAFIESKLGHIDEAIHYIDKVMVMPDSNQDELKVLKGHIYLENQKYKEGQRCYEEAIDHTNSPQVLYHSAVSFYENGLFLTAYEMLQTILFAPHKDWNKGFSYLAACARELHKEDEYIKYLRIAVKKNPQEARRILGKYFPDGMKPSQYEDFLETLR